MSTALVPAPEPVIDPALLDGAVQFLNRAVQVSGLQLATQVSTYVVDTFFAGDFALLSSKDPHKTASFRALSEHPGLQMGATTLYRLVRIGQQARHLPQDLAERLSLSHHRLLLTVDNPQHKQHLARLAAQHGWSVAELQAQIQAELPQPDKTRGRPAQAPVVRWLAALQRQADGGLDAGQFAAGVAGLSAEQQARVRAGLAVLRERLADLEAALPPG
jgi:hypothetical protein